MTFGSSRTWFFFVSCSDMHASRGSLAHSHITHSFIYHFYYIIYFFSSSFLCWCLGSFFIFFSSFVSLSIAAVCVFIAVTSHDS